MNPKPDLGVGGLVMDEQLYRQEALDALKYKDHGRPIAYYPQSWSIITTFILAMVIVAAIFIAIGTYARKEEVQGLLKSSLSESRVFANRSGTLQQLLVNDGDLVTKDQPLLVISTPKNLDSGELYQHRARALVEEEITLVRTRLSATETNYQHHKLGVQSQLKGIKSQIKHVEEQLQLELRALTLLKQEYEASRVLLEKNVISKIALDKIDYSLLEKESDISQIRERIANLKTQIITLENRLVRLDSDEVKELSTNKITLSRLEQDLTDIQAEGGYTLKAPVSGFVTATQVTEGNFVDSSYPLLIIVPEGSTLHAEIYIPSRAIGFITLGQPVKLLYDAFPYERFGPGYGHIESISNTILSPQEVSSVITVTEPVFKVKVKLEQQTINAFGKEMPLRSGISLKAEIILEELTFLEWLLNPVRARISK